MVRTKNQIRGSKSKGSQYEMSVRDSLLAKYPDILLTKQEGFVSQMDIIDHTRGISIECKKHKGFSWNELTKYYYKLKGRSDEKYTPFLIFQANRQPCLVMHEYPLYIGDGVRWGLQVRTFESVFGVPFIVHNAKKKEETEDEL